MQEEAVARLAAPGALPVPWLDLPLTELVSFALESEYPNDRRRRPEPPVELVVAQVVAQPLAPVAQAMRLWG